ncbi:MAG: sensor histidine kinase [Roseovarius sp.]
MAANTSDSPALPEPSESSGFRALPNPAMIVDRAGLICTVNARAERQFRHAGAQAGRTDEMCLSDIFDIAPVTAAREIRAAASGDVLILRPRDTDASADGPWRFRVGAIRSGAPVTERYVLVSEGTDALANPFRALNAELEAANDMARRERWARQQLEKSNAQLNEANAELRSFVYAVSHDLKSPVQTVTMLLSEAESGDDPPLGGSAAELIDMSRQTLARMSTLIEDLLHYTELVGAEASLVPCALNDVVDDVVADLRAEIVAARAQVLRDDLPVVPGDAVMLRLLFQHLMSNAVKFRHPDRAPVVAVRCAPSQDGCQVAVSVIDNGIGIAPEYRERVFELFGRLHRHDEIAGSGLGLTMCRRIARCLHATLDLSENPGGGCIFTLHTGVAEDV